MSVPFSDVIRQARNGLVSNKLTEALAEVVLAVKDAKKPGELTLKIKVEPDKHGDFEHKLKFDITTKMPKEEGLDATFYSDIEGNLLRTNPSQTDMFRDTASSAQRAAAE